jgi:hypothetical protein
MPQHVTDIGVLRDYIRGVMDRADHHAQSVSKVALTIAGAVIWRKDDEPLEVMARQGEMKNVLWFKVNGQRYAISYNHETGEIELRQGTTRGDIVRTFSNATPASVVRSVFAGL